MTPAGFPHSDTPGSTLGCQLPRAYRRLLRPSSALDAKASTMCPSQLVTHTTNPTHHQPATSNTKNPTRHPHPTNREDKNQHSHSETRQPDNTMNQTWQCTQHTTKMLASTIQISNNNPTPAPHHAPQGDGHEPGHRTPHPPGPGPPHREPTRTTGPDTPTPQGSLPGAGLIPQNPNSVPPPDPAHTDTSSRQVDDSTT